MSKYGLNCVKTSVHVCQGLLWLKCTVISQGYNPQHTVQNLRRSDVQQDCQQTVNVKARYVVLNIFKQTNHVQRLSCLIPTPQLFWLIPIAINFYLFNIYNFHLYKISVFKKSTFNFTLASLIITLQGGDSQNFLLKFVRFFLTLGRKILILLKLKVVFEVYINKS